MSSAEKSAFVFYPTFVEQITAIKNKEVQLALSLALMRYGVYNEVPDFSEIDPLGLVEAAFLPMRTAIDEQRKRRETQRINGLKGGAPKGSRNNPNGRRGKDEELTETNPNKPELTETNLNIDINKDIDKKDNIENKRGARFIPPSLNEVKLFFNESGFKSNPEAFFDYYDANGWTQGKGKPLKQWKAAARQWERREPEFARPQRQASTKPNATTIEPDYSDTDFGGRKY